jgi:hypothetical protein
MLHDYRSLFMDWAIVATGLAPDSSSMLKSSGNSGES